MREFTIFYYLFFLISFFKSYFLGNEFFMEKVEINLWGNFEMKLIEAKF